MPGPPVPQGFVPLFWAVHAEMRGRPPFGVPRNRCLIAAGEVGGRGPGGGTLARLCRVSATGRAAPSRSTVVILCSNSDLPVLSALGQDLLATLYGSEVRQ